MGVYLMGTVINLYTIWSLGLFSRCILCMDSKITDRQLEAQRSGGTGCSKEQVI